MGRLVRQRAQKLGLPPGSLVFSGEARAHAVRMTVIDYDEETLDEHDLTDLREVYPFRDRPTVSWINVDGVHNVEVVQQIGEHFGVHPLVLEDILHTGQRPKVESYDDQLYVVIKMLYYEERRHLIQAEQVSLIVGPRYLLSFQETPGDVFELVRQRLRAGTGRLRRSGPDYLAYALIDVIIDHYFLVLEVMSDQIEALEIDVLGDPKPETQEAISDLHREIILLRKAVWPVRELVNGLERVEAPLITPELRPYLRDAYDHAVQVIDVVESLRDMLSVLRESYKSSLSNRMNEIMKVLTIIATIFIPLTFIAGVYGMNFAYMPELKMHYGYPAALLVMLVIGGALVVYFRWKNWF